MTRIISDILEIVADETGVSVMAMQSPTKRRPIVRARWAAIWIAHEKLGLSLSEIGRFFGFDHTSIGYAVRQFSQLLATGEADRETVRKMAELAAIAQRPVFFRHHTLHPEFRTQRAAQ